MKEDREGEESKSECSGVKRDSGQIEKKRKDIREMIEKREERKQRANRVMKERCDSGQQKMR